MFEFTNDITKDICKAFKCLDFGGAQIATIKWDFIKEIFPKYFTVVDLFIKYTASSPCIEYLSFPLTDTLVNIALLFEKANNYDEYLLAFNLFIDKYVENVVKKQIIEHNISKENEHIFYNFYNSIIYNEYLTTIEKICSELCNKEISIGET